LVNRDQIRREVLLEVGLWAELRREHFVRGVPIKELVRRTGLARNTIKRALRSSEPPAYRREAAGSKLDPFLRMRSTGC
jgi:hypothetical protein